MVFFPYKAQIRLTKIPVVTISALLVLLCSASVEVEAAIDSLYPPMPAGYTQADVGVFPDEDPNSERVHTLSWISGPNGDWLWLSRRVDEDGGYTRWRVVASMAIPPPKRGRALIFLLCLIDDKPDPEVVAVVDYKPELQTLTVIHDAWRANRRTYRFEKIAPRGVSCINESYGL